MSIESSNTGKALSHGRDTTEGHGGMLSIATRHGLGPAQDERVVASAAASRAITLRDWVIMEKKREKYLAEREQEALEALESHNAKAFVKAVEKEVLPSRATKQYFQRTPFTSSLTEEVVPPVESPFAHGFIHEVAFPHAVTKRNLSAPYIRDIYSKGQDLWDNRGLGTAVQKAHCRWRRAYVKRIREIIDTILPEDPPDRIRVARELFSSTELGSPCRTPFYRSFLPVLVELYLSPERDSMADRGGRRVDSTGRDLILYQHLNGKPVREMFSIVEEAFVLTITRKHLVHKFGTRVFAVLPTGGGFDPAGLEPADDGEAVPSVPEILGDYEDVAPDSTISNQDARYFREVCSMLVMYQTLSDSASVIGDMLDVFCCPHPERGSSPVLDEGNSKRFCM